MHDAFGYLGVLCCLVAFAAGVTGVWHRLRRDRVFCPSPRGRSRLSPVRVVWMPRCGYDLSGAVGGVCPECGRPVRPGRNLRWAGPVRLAGVFGSSLIIAAGCAGLRASIRSGTYVRWTPTTALVLLERPGASRDYRLQGELNRRVDAGRLNAWQTRWLCKAMADELHAPNLAWGPGLNARSDFVRARRTLTAMWPASRGTIEELVGSPRWDVACFATDTLLDRLGDRPTPLLLEAAVEQVRDDRGGGGRYSAPGNARRYAGFLIDHAAEALPFLEAALASEDWQQRAVVAAIIVTEGVGDRQEEAAGVLVATLAGNGHGGDGLLAAVALSRASEAAVGALERGARASDPQQAAWCRALLDARKGADWSRIEPWLEPFRLTTRTRDPRVYTTRQAISMLGW